jgi:hypothetical protein
MEKTYKNIYYLFWVILALIFWGFYKTYFGLFPSFEGIKYIHHFHALMFLCWVTFLIIQPILIRKKQFEWHRIVGKASYVLVPLLLLSVALVVRNEQLRAKNLMNLTFVFSDMSFFLLMYGLAIYYKKRTSFHIRYMVMTILPFTNPAVARILQGFPTVLISLVIIIGLLIFERFRAKVYRPLAVGLVALFVFYGGYSLLPPTFWDSVWQFFFS